jgi:hypothetical protein
LWIPPVARTFSTWDRHLRMLSLVCLAITELAVQSVILTSYV